MKLILVAIAFIVLASLYLFYPILRAIQVSKGIQDASVPYEQHPENPTMRILVAGDSTGVGTGAESPRDSIAGRIGSDFPNADIQNISENGITLEVLKGKLFSLPEIKYDLIVIQIGANDVVKFTSKKKVTEELKLVLDYAEEHSTSVVLLTAGNIGLSPVFKWPLSKAISIRTLMVREIFQTEASERPTVDYVDLFKSAEEDIFSKDIYKYYAKDFFHPSGDGYEVWYQDVRKYIK